MRNKAPSHRPAMLLACMAVVAAWTGMAFAAPPNVVLNTDFSSLPSGGTLVGTAALSSGVLHLTDAVGSQTGTFIYNPGGQVLRAPRMKCDLLIGGGTEPGADGISFCYGDLSGGAFGESGDGLGLRVRIRTYTHNVLEIMYGGLILSTVALVHADIRTNTWVTFEVNVTHDGYVTVIHNGNKYVDNFAIAGWNPQSTWLAGIGGRTGGANDNHWVDNLTLRDSEPYTLSITRADADPVWPPRTSAGYDVVFSEVVQNLGAADFALTQVSGNPAASISSVAGPAVSASEDFASGAGVGTLLGTAAVSGGLLHLTDAANTQTGTWTYAPGQALPAFRAAFDLLIGGGNGADGFAFAYGENAGTTFSHEGPSGSGLVISFDTYENGGEGTPNITVRLDGSDLYVVSKTLRTGTLVPVVINVSSSGLCSVTHDGTLVANDIVLPGWNPSAGWYVGMGASTGGLNDNHHVDNFSLSYPLYDVTLDSLSGAGDLRLDLSGASVQDLDGAALDPNSVTGDETYTFDFEAPAAPSIPDLVASSDTGLYDNDNVTSDTTPQFSGTAEAGSTVRIYSDVDGEVGSGVATSGSYSITVSGLSSGSHAITATATDVASNTSSPSGALAVTIDTASATPVVSYGGADPTNASPIQFSVQCGENLYGAPLVAGDFTITGGTFSSTTFADGASSFTVNVAPSGSVVTVSLQLNAGVLADLAGNSSNQSNTLSVDYDSVAPSPVVTYSGADPTNTSPVQFSVDCGEAVYGAPLTASDFTIGGGTFSGTSFSDGDSSFTVDVTPSSTVATVTLRVSAAAVSDAAANLSVLSNEASVDYDSVAPTADTVSPTTPSPTNATAVSFSVEFSEVVESFNAETDLDVTLTGTVAYSGVGFTDLNGQDYFVQLTGVTGDGTIALAVNTGSDVQDPAGNALASSVTSSTVEIDQTAPTADTIAPTTPSPTNGSTVSFSVQFSEVVENFSAGADLDVTLTGTVAYSGVGFTNLNGQSYFVQFTGVTGDGTIALAVDTGSDVQDPATNGVASSVTSTAVVVDHSGPAITVTPQTTADTTPTVTGTVDDGTGVGVAGVTVTVNAQSYTADVVGTTWSADVTNALAEGTYDVAARATDTLGNVGNDSTSDELTVDLTVPAVTVDSLATNDSTPVLSGTAVAQSGFTVASVDVTVNGQVYSADISSLPVWTAQVTNALGSATYEVLAEAADDIGRVGTDNTTGELRVDLDAPTATITLDDPNPTALDAVSFSVDFGEPVGTSFDASDVTLTGTLAGAAGAPLVSGTDPDYTVTVTLNDPDDDGTLGIDVGTGVVDEVGNPYAGGSSSLYTIHNWLGFTAQPAGADLYTGGSHTLTVAADYGNSAISYQWKHDDLLGKAVHDVGSDSPTYEIPIAAIGDSGDYWCVVTYDGLDYASDSASVQVADHLAITAHPASAGIDSGSSHTFTVATSGGLQPLDYQWWKDGVSLVSATASSWEIVDADEEDGGVYHVVISDGGTDVLASNTAVLTINESTLPAAGPAVLGLLAAACALGGFGAIRRRH